MRAMGEFRATFGVKRIYDPPADDDGFRVLELARAHPRITLLYAARNTGANNAHVLLDYLRGQSAG
ncbi:hypothetical protein MRBLMD1_003798 [Pseudarthrobacter sp. LMD1-1-1.1]